MIAEEVEGGSGEEMSGKLKQTREARVDRDML
jgi:hypothetical protein